MRQVLLENLPLLERIIHPGKIATVFEGLDDLKPTFTGLRTPLISTEQTPHCNYSVHYRVRLLETERTLPEGEHQQWWSNGPRWMAERKRRRRGSICDCSLAADLQSSWADQKVVPRFDCDSGIDWRRAHAETRELGLSRWRDRGPRDVERHLGYRPFGDVARSHIG